MFIIHHFNQPDSFKNLLFRVIEEKKLSNPMQSEIILVDNNIMAQWIKIELANYFSIAANFNFMDMQSFMKTIYKKILLDNSINDSFSYFNMFWKFMEILPKIRKLENCDILQDYLYDDYHQKKCGQCAAELANLFTRYLIYRPDWLNLWASHKMAKNVDFNYQIWQSEIWRTFLKYIHQHDDSKNFVNPWEYCINVLKIAKQFDYNIPSRIFIFGITSIAPIFWKILKILSRDIDIYLGFMNLGYYNWNNISDQDLLFNMKSNQKTLTFYNYFPVDNLCNNAYYNNNINISHPLLTQWGNIGKNTLHLLSMQFQNVLEIKTYSHVNNNSLLHILQKEILEFKKYIKFTHKIVSKEQKKHILTLDDQSITFHVCHSIQREVEVLHDNLLSMFVVDPLLSPEDIMVMATDICVYEAAIHSVFNNMHGRNLPFIITNYQDVCIHTVTSTFLNILEIFYKNKFTSEEILSLLSVSLVANRFDMKEEELKLLCKWTNESGIRWGLDEINIYNENRSVSINMNKNTWYFGLYRMLMGYMIDSQYGVWNDIIPYDGVIGDIDIVEKLGNFLTILKKWKERLHRSYTLQIWSSYIKEIINDFFYYSDVDIEVNTAIIKLKTNCIDILMIGIQSGYLNCINVITLKDQLFYQLNQSSIIFRFFPNAIKFCNITPICAIPCKIVCFLGMNENIFPRNNVSYNFDLIAKYPRYSDNNIYEKDYYAFLSALLLAKEKIYISFVGYHHDYSLRIPSIVIHELLDYISIRFCLKGDEYLGIEENIKHIRQLLFRWYPPFIFSLENFLSSSKYQSFAKEWFFFNNIHSTKNNLCIKSCCYNINILPKYTNNIISFYDLYRFYLHPIRTWSQKRLGVYFDQNVILNSFNNEPFSVDMIHHFFINMKLIDYLIYNKNIDQLYDKIRCSGILPYGSFGELFWINQCKKMNMLFNKIKTYIFSEKNHLNISLKFGALKLIGQLPNVRKNGLFRWKPTYLSMKDVFLLWLEHVIYCSIGGTGNSILFGINDVNNTWCFSNLSILRAKELLLLLIKGYLSGMNMPLFLLYRSGGSWMNNMFDWRTKSISMDYDCQKNANQKLVQIWKGPKYKDNISYFIKGECCDPYLKMLLPFDLGIDDINKIINTAKEYFIHPMMNRIHIT